MRILSLDADTARAISAWDSTGVRNRPVLRSSTGCTTDLLPFAPGSHLGRHAAGWAQLFYVAAGSGWVSGADGVRRRITAGQAACWENGEQHESGSEPGMTAVVVQAAHPEALCVLAETSETQGDETQGDEAVPTTSRRPDRTAPGRSAPRR